MKQYRVEIFSALAALALAAAVGFAQAARAGGDKEPARSPDGWSAPGAKALTLDITGMS